jgi:protease I
MPAIDKSHILIMATNGFEQSELEKPLEQLRAKGAKVEVAAPQAGEIKGWKDGNWGSPVKVDLTLNAVNIDNYDALVLPGGVINPDKLRTDERAVGIVKAFVASGKPVAAICHGPWLLIEAGAVKGREVTSYTSSEPTCSTPAAAGWIRRWPSTRGSSRPAIQATSTPSSPRSSKRLVRASTGAQPR